jgi:hypothetical protein
MIRKHNSSHDYSTQFELTISVEYEYDPGEKEVRYFADGSGHPGSSPSVEIQKITCGPADRDITCCFSYEDLRSLEEESLENHEPFDHHEE